MGKPDQEWEKNVRFHRNKKKFIVSFPGNNLKWKINLFIFHCKAIIWENYAAADNYVGDGNLTSIFIVNIQQTFQISNIFIVNFEHTFIWSEKGIHLLGLC